MIVRPFRRTNANTEAISSAGGIAAGNSSEAAPNLELSACNIKDQNLMVVSG
jgi:hypothetical protein